MKLARIIARAYGRYRLRTFECETCKVSYTEGEPDEERSAD